MKIFKADDILKNAGSNDPVKITDDIMDSPCPNCGDNDYFQCKDKNGKLVEAICINCGWIEEI